ncbi:FAD-dependent oxidoreductase [Candidatus Desantisbacteria bacterium]|nr:FAD-dependent oxidoreductase [Candidatus Desantisbacteria bacterium]
MIEKKLVIVGGGPAGMAAAISAYEHGVSDILLIDREPYLGGILNQCIHTGFGLKYFKETLTGPEYAGRFIKKIKDISQIEVSLNTFVASLNKNKTLTVLKPGLLVEIKPEALIMATGCREKTREMMHIAGTRPAGIFSAGLAQKLINIEGLIPGREVVIIGSGDIGLIMARRFTLEGAKVKAVIEIRQKSRGLARNIAQCIEDFNIPIFFNHKILRIFGRDRVEKISVCKVDNNLNIIPDTTFEIACDTAVLSAGLIPENELIEMAGVEIDKKTNTPVTNELNKTSILGIFVCGNSFKIYDIVDSVTEDSFIAGQQAAEYLGRLR